VSELNLIMLGPPGAGKGTQAERLREDFGLLHIATGDILRAEVANGSDLGSEAKRYMDDGELVPDSVIIGMITERVGGGDARDGFLLDGFPRNEEQADALRDALAVLDRRLNAALLIEVPDDELVRRLAGRRMCVKNPTHIYHVEFDPPKHADVCDQDGSRLIQRDDDREETIRRRLGVYHSQTEPLIAYYGAASTACALPMRSTTTYARPSRRSNSRRSCRPLIVKKSPREIEKMGRAGEILVSTLAELETRIRPGVTTAQLDAAAERFIRGRGGVPTFKGYRGFPGSICASPNAMVVHGIPGPYRLSKGDVISIDVGVTLDGWVADAARTFPVGEISADAERLLAGTEAALHAGVAQCVAGKRMGDVSSTIQRTAEAAGLSVVRSLVGHGIGRSMHEDPQVPNYGKPGKGPLLEEGMVLAVEPMMTAGGASVRVGADGWAIYSEDSSLAAHFEFTVAITADGPLVLTPWHQPLRRTQSRPRASKEPAAAAG